MLRRTSACLIIWEYLLGSFSKLGKYYRLKFFPTRSATTDCQRPALHLLTSPSFRRTVRHVFTPQWQRVKLHIDVDGWERKLETHDPTSNGQLCLRRTAFPRLSAIMNNLWGWVFFVEITNPFGSTQQSIRFAHRKHNLQTFNYQLALFLRRSTCKHRRQSRRRSSLTWREHPHRFNHR